MTDPTRLPAANRHALCDSEDLAFEMALGYFSDDALCLKFGIDLETLDAVKVDRAFRVLLLEQSRKIDERGDGFRLEARRHMEEMLQALADIASDGDTAKGSRMKAIELLGKYAGYEDTSENTAGVMLEIRTNLDVGGAKTTAGTYTVTANPDGVETPAPVAGPDDDGGDDLL